MFIDKLPLWKQMPFWKRFRIIAAPFKSTDGEAVMRKHLPKTAKPVGIMALDTTFIEFYWDASTRKTWRYQEGHDDHVYWPNVFFGPDKAFYELF